jgi:hypothetical protein
MNSSSPTAANPFMTASAVLADYIPRTGTPPGAPVSGDIVFQETPFPAPNPKLRNEAGGSYVEFYRPFFSAMSGQATNPGTLTGFAYSYFDGFNVTSFFPVGTPIQIKNTQNESNDGIHLITATEWDGVTNWIQWAGMTTEVAAPFGDIAFQWEGTIFSAEIPDVLGTKAASAFVDPTGSYFTLRKGVYGTPGYLNGSIVIVDNFAGDVGGFFTYDGYPIVVAGQDYTIRQGVVSSVVGPGRQANVKTNYATYTENIAFNRSSGGTETLFNADKTTNVDRLITLPDESGIVPVGPGWDTLIANPTLGQDGYVIAWNNTNNEYELVPDATGVDTNIANSNLAFTEGRILDLATFNLDIDTGAGGKMRFSANPVGPPATKEMDIYVTGTGAFIHALGAATPGGTPLTIIGGEQPGQRGVKLQTPSNILEWNDATNVLVHDASAVTGTKTVIWRLTDVQTGQTYNVANVTTDRDYDANASTVGELADVLGTLVTDLQNIGILS